jgi:hypothetical protein
MRPAAAAAFSMSFPSLVDRSRRECGERTVQPRQRAKRAAVGCNRKFAAWKNRRLQQLEELISFDLAIAENCRE